MANNAHDYYRHPEVIKRMLEYCGVPAWIIERSDIGYPQGYGPLKDSRNLRELGKLMTAMYLVEYGLRVKQGFTCKEPWQLGQILDKKSDVFRSVHDEDNLICLLDVEKVNHNDPGANYKDMVGLFWDLEPFHQALMSVYRDYGFSPLVIATGQGYHYGFRVPKDDANSNAYELLQSLGFVSHEERIKNQYRRHGSRRRRIVTDDEAWANDGWSKLIEFMSIQAMRRARKYGNRLPVVIGDQWAKGGVVISVDLSAFADPMFMRDIRLPFSLHQKHMTSPWKVGHETAAKTPYIIAIPRFTPCNGNEISLDDLFRLRRNNYHDAANYAGSIRTYLPVMSWGVENLVRAYLGSDVHEAHQIFDQGMKMFEFSNYKQMFSKKYNELKHIRLHPDLEAKLNTCTGDQLNPNVIKAVTDKFLSHDVHPADIVAYLAGKLDHLKILGGYKSSPVKRIAGWVRAFFVQYYVGMSNPSFTKLRY